MNARSAKPTSHRRYRRRILGWGAVGVAGIFAVGGPIFVNRAEDDLERRAVVELEAAGVGDVTPKFSGQDGELRCKTVPVDIPDDVVESIRGLWGVSSLDVAASCTDGNRESSASDDAAVTSTEVAPTTESGEDGAPDTTSTTVAESPPPVPDLDVAAVVANDSQFSTLTGLLGDAGLTDTLTTAGPFTLFAPTDAAFEALGADITGTLARDPDLLATVLTHHVTAGLMTSTELADGTIEMLDETPVTVDLSDGVTLISGDSVAAVTEPDLQASNGVVHAIDRVLLPDGLLIGTDPTTVLAGADFIDGQITLRGTVASEAQRDTLVAAAEAQVDAANVVDELVVDVDADADVDAGGAAVGALADVIAAMPLNLVSGTAELTGEGITVLGVTADGSSGDAFDAAVADITGATVTTTLTARAAADVDAAAALEADLNALVAANPILFDQSSISISTESAATLDRVAALANRVGGVDIEIQGYTDTDGAADSNQAISDGRARSVRIALAERGIDDATLSTVGFGGAEPIFDADGAEDKAASRRVEFVVTATQ